MGVIGLDVETTILFTWAANQHFRMEHRELSRSRPPSFRSGPLELDRTCSKVTEMNRDATQQCTLSTLVLMQQRIAITQSRAETLDQIESDPARNATIQGSVSGDSARAIADFGQSFGKKVETHERQ